MEALARIFRSCSRNIELLTSRGTPFQLAFSGPAEVLFDHEINIAPLAQAPQKTTLEESFYKALQLRSYYEGLTDESVLLRDMLLQIGADQHLFPFAGKDPGTVCFTSLNNSREETEQLIKNLSDLFLDTFGYPLEEKNLDTELAKRVLNERLADAKEFFLETHGAWIENFMNELGDDLSRVSFLTYLRQRILAKIFSDSDICYPVQPPTATAAWRRERESLKQKFPVLFDVNGKKLGDRHFCLVYTYQQYALPGQVEVPLGGTVVDAGAFIGDTAAWFADCVGEKGKVFSFEPSLRNVRQGEKNMEHNGIHNVEFIPCALSDRQGSIGVVENDSSSSANRIVVLGDNDDAEGAIQMLTLDSLREKLGKVDFIKADIEGSEMAMLRGATETITRAAPICAICLYHKRDDFWEIPKFLKKLRPEYKFWFRCEAEPVLFAKCENMGTAG